MKAFCAGNYKALYEKIEHFVLTYPEAPETSLYIPDVARLCELVGFERAERTLNLLLKKLKNSKASYAALYRLKINLEKEKLLAVYKRDALGDFSGQFYSLRDWTALGPYSKYGAGDLDTVFLPEIVHDLYKHRIRKKYIHDKSPDGVIDLHDYFYPEKGVAYAVTTLRPGKAFKIRIYSKNEYKLFINGKTAVRNARDGTYRKFRVVQVNSENEVTLLLKILKNNKWNFRVIITGIDDIPIDVKGHAGGIVTSECNCFEVMDFPYTDFLSGKEYPHYEKFFKIANYFYELGSSEAIKFYEKAASGNKDPVYNYFYARSLLDRASKNSSSAFYSQGMEAIYRILKKDIWFIPAAYLKFSDLFRQKHYEKALNLGKKLLARAPSYLPLRDDYIRLLDVLDLNMEFRKEAFRFQRDFPHSTLPMLQRASHNYNININRTIEVYREILRKKYNPGVVRSLSSIYLKRGDAGRALQLLKKYHTGRNPEKEIIKLYIENAMYGEAKKIAFHGTILKEDPRYYWLLGLATYLKKEDPSLYWAKMIALSPSDFGVEELLDYLQTRRATVPMEQYRKENAMKILTDWLAGKTGKSRSEIIFRERIYILNHDGSNRLFAEDIIYIKDRKGIDKWGEYKISQKGTLNPVRIRVYSGDGSFQDSYRIEKVNGSYYINLSGLKPDSIVHIVYYLDNPHGLQGDPDFFSVPFTIVHNFNEKLGYFRLVVVTPREMKTAFATSSNLVLRRKESNGRTIYVMEKKDFKEIRSESYMGSGLNHLPYYALCTMSGEYDFTRWYASLLREARRREPALFNKQIKGKSPLETIHSVYDYVTRNIELQANVLYYPESPSETRFKKRGTPEDKAFMAKELLSDAGIPSYMAFARKRDFPDTGRFISPDLFSHVLLYVPIGQGRALWLDFSDRYIPCGTVDNTIDGSSALVIYKDTYEWKAIESTRMNGSRNEYFIHIDSAGNARCRAEMKFYGTENRIKKYFEDKNYREEILHKYFSGFIKTLGIKEYSIENELSTDRDLVIRIEGSAFSLSSPATKTFIFQPLLKKSLITRYILSPSREKSLVISQPVNESERYRYYIPSFYASSEINTTKYISCRFGFAVITIRKDKGSSEVLVKKEVHFGRSVIGPNDYGEFLLFCRKLKKAEQQNIILVK